MYLDTVRMLCSKFNPVVHRVVFVNGSEESELGRDDDKRYNFIRKYLTTTRGSLSHRIVREIERLGFELTEKV